MGAAGRMGRALVREIANAPGFALAGASERKGAPELGQDAGVLAGLKPLGVKLTDDALPLFAKADAVLDFTVPAASVEHAGFAAQARIVHVLGTTGLTPADDKAIAAAARHARIVRSGNFSLGVNLLAALTRQAARALGPDFDIEILEMHHRMKVDAPSGTALLLGRAAAEGRGLDFEKARARPRDGETGARKTRRDRLCLACAAARWRATTRSSSRAKKSASCSPTSPRTAPSSRAGRCARLSGRKTRSPGFIPWPTCSGSAHDPEKCPAAKPPIRE